MQTRDPTRRPTRLPIKQPARHPINPAASCNPSAVAKPNCDANTFSICSSKTQMKCGKWCRPHYHYQLQGMGNEKEYNMMPQLPVPLPLSLLLLLLMMSRMMAKHIANASLPMMAMAAITEAKETPGVATFLLLFFYEVAKSWR